MSDWRVANGLQLFALSAFAVAAPLLDVLSRHPELFVVHDADALDVVLLLALLCGFLPAALLLVEGVAQVTLGASARRVVHGVGTALLGGVALLSVLQRWDAPALASLTFAGAGGVLLAFAASRFGVVRVFLVFLAPLSLVFPISFLANDGVVRLLRRGEGAASSDTVRESATPIVMVIFDELALTPLLDAEQRIDAVRFPHFARLAATATWFRNATTVADGTTLAVPAILTGRLPKAMLLPTASDHPENLFTLLAGSHEIRSHEPVTRLCPPPLCRSLVSERRRGQREWALLTDSAVIYLHAVLPKDLVAGLPPIDTRWGFFTGAGEGRDRVALFRAFVDSLGQGSPAGRPAFHFHHALLPHVPWEYLPSGQRYGPIDARWYPDGLSGGVWSEDPWFAALGFQRYLLQLRHVDMLLGELLGRLEAKGLLDAALLVVTSDHGISFQPGEAWRSATEANHADMMSIPLFIKAPGQRRGRVSDRNVETIDIVPTMAALLELPISWAADGQSALDLSLPERDGKAIFNFPGARQLAFGGSLPDRAVALARQLEVVGTGGHDDRLFAIGAHPELVNRAVQELDRTDVGGGVVAIDWPEVYADVDPRAPIVPARITGRLLDEPADVPVWFAVAVNGEIRTVTRSFEQGGEARFSALVPAASFRPGPNSVELWRVVEREDGSLQLARAEPSAPVTYSLADREGAEALVSSRGEVFALGEGALRGELERWGAGRDGVFVEGWAVDFAARAPPEAILVFLDGQLAYAGAPNRGRPDVAQQHGLAAGGFDYRLPPSLYPGGGAPEIRVFALSSAGLATELR